MKKTRSRSRRALNRLRASRELRAAEGAITASAKVIAALLKAHPEAIDATMRRSEAYRRLRRRLASTYSKRPVVGRH